MIAGRPARLLLVVVEFPPLGGGGVLRATKLVKYLARLGWDITVVCSDEPILHAPDPSLLDDIPTSVRIDRIKGPFRALGSQAGAIAQTGDRRPILARPTNWLKVLVRSVLVPDRWIGWAWRAGRANLGIERPDVVVSSGPPHSAHIAGRRQARRYGAPHVIDLRDDWSANPLHRNRLPWHDPLDAAIERRTVGGAAAIVVVSDAARDVYASVHPRLADRIRVITNGFDPEDIPAAQGAAQTGPPVFLHAGSLRNNRREAAPLFVAFGRYVRQPDDGILELLGPISPEHEAEARRHIPAGHLRLEGSVPHTEALQRMSMAHVLVVVTSEAEAGPATMTGKIFEYLATGKPILLVAPEGPATKLIRETGAGQVAKPTDADEILAAISRAAEQARDPTFAGAPKELLRRYDRRVLAEEWSLALRSLGEPTLS